MLHMRTVSTCEYASSKDGDPRCISLISAISVMVEDDDVRRQMGVE